MVFTYIRANRLSLEKAEDAYSRLTEAQKTSVATEYLKLSSLKVKYNELVSGAAKVDEVKALISAIGRVDITDACKQRIEAAESAYSLLSGEQKQLVTNYTILQNAREEYNGLISDNTKAEQPNRTRQEPRTKPMTKTMAAHWNAIFLMRSIFPAPTF